MMSAEIRDVRATTFDRSSCGCAFRFPIMERSTPVILLRATLVHVIGFLVLESHGQGDASWWRDDLLVSGEGGIVWRKPEVAGDAQRIGTGVHTDGTWGLGARLELRNTVISLGWSRYKQSLFYTVDDQGRTTSKRTLPSLAYTSLPVRLGQRFPVWHRRLHAVPYLTMAWSFTDEAPGPQPSSRGDKGLQIDGATGDTVRTVTTSMAHLLERNTFTLGPGLEFDLTVGRWTVLAGLEYLWSTAPNLEYTVTYERTSTLSGSYQEQALIRRSPTTLAMRWGLMFRLSREPIPDAGTW